MEATTGTADDTSAVDVLIRGHTQSMGRLPQAVVGDKHYGSSEVLNYLDQRGITAVMKPRRINNRPGFLTIDDFRYDPEHDQYVCPQGEVLKLKVTQRTLHRKNYADSKESCTSCPLRDRCTTGKKEGRLLTKFIDNHFENALELVKTDWARGLLRQRQIVSEGTFGEAKAYLLLRRALFRGRLKLKIQLLLTATVLNLKRLMKWKARSETRIQPVTA
ncbi:MAG: transposase [Candidatus Zixiibacteriota bacterium]